MACKWIKIDIAFNRKQSCHVTKFSFVACARKQNRYGWNDNAFWRDFFFTHKYIYIGWSIKLFSNCPYWLDELAIVTPYNDRIPIFKCECSVWRDKMNYFLIITNLDKAKNIHDWTSSRFYSFFSLVFIPYIRIHRWRERKPISHWL